MKRHTTKKFLQSKGQGIFVLYKKNGKRFSKNNKNEMKKKEQ